MSTRPFFSAAAMTLPFSHNGQPGQVNVYYGAVDDARRAGFDALPGLALPLDLCVGYPAMQAVIDSYGGAGYRELCGWIQVITRHDTSDDDSQVVVRSTSIDQMPAFSDLGMPFCVAGMLPTFFDAPCLNLGGSQALEWIADTWLVTVPVRSRQEPIEPLLGFQWGYREFASDLGRPVELLPLKDTGPAAWEGHLDLLRRDCPNWLFGQARYGD